MAVRQSLVVFVVAAFGMAACTSSGSNSTTRNGDADSVPALSVTTTTVQREQSVPARSRYVIDGQEVGLTCQGSGRIPVVFQAGGAVGGVIWTGGEIIPALGPDVFTCTFDRPGVAYDSISTSVPVGTELMTPSAIEKLLVETLAEADVGPRVILVGHSLGGMNAVAFGADYPDLVAGAVLLDPSIPAALTDPVNRQGYSAAGIDPDAVVAEMEAVRSWPPVPLVVLTRDLSKGVTPERAQEVSDWHRRYAGLTPQGIQQEVPGTTHNDFVLSGVATEPVLDAISRVIRDSA